jgi:hypothetical protein
VPPLLELLDVDPPDVDPPDVDPPDVDPPDVDPPDVDPPDVDPPDVDPPDVDPPDVDAPLLEPPLVAPPLLVPSSPDDVPCGSPHAATRSADVRASRPRARAGVERSITVLHGAGLESPA